MDGCRAAVRSTLVSGRPIANKDLGPLCYCNGVVQLKYGDTINIFICMNYGGGVSRKKQMVSKGLALFNKSLRLHLVVALQTASRNAGFHFLRPLGRASSS